MEMHKSKAFIPGLSEAKAKELTIKLYDVLLEAKVTYEQGTLLLAKVLAATIEAYMEEN